MHLSSLHFLLSYRCTSECDHCFVWSSPRQSGTMTLEQVRDCLQQARETGTVESVEFEGGEPFLYYPILNAAVRLASEMGFRVGVVSNAYWATTVDDAIEWLRPFAGRIASLEVSSDLFHHSEKHSQEVRNAAAAADELGITVGNICIAQPEAANAAARTGQLPLGESAVMYRGRAAVKLIQRTGRRSWTDMTECPHEDLHEPGRVHVDPFGNLHLCQGISIGNLFEKPLEAICAEYDPKSHPIIGPLREGGPVELVRRYNLPHRDEYADACHLCYESRLALREQFGDVLTPDQMYGDVSKESAT